MSAGDATDFPQGGRNTDDASFKKTSVVVGKPETTDHNIADDYVNDPPKNVENAHHDEQDGQQHDLQNKGTSQQPSKQQLDDQEEMRQRMSKN
ncbi:uncharacterized protein L969DRAFT_92759 [Mixia osmundae IAM 14324]|uniref:Uncharacterized protein n=1 Tax=Mixia osmundae (strain CBS 9802 / IAM 14324 / JCM 22182 / KY 12970) TaxID=764103 RepID=G7DYH0_MIXOS|nr:uncharacterized protein L969DRAFT_92759 [Mixia osmundae IAM 14324]KEI41531.1 hypothetical protein L969DRAFT_92759 [Mixia osmundae IAM 14324]GAA95630.1 hypothetical protein E5Q_02286 [Mixia osmundae IAM 14324]